MAKKGYIVVCYREVRDPEKVKKYSELAPLAMRPRGAKILAGDGRVRGFEHGLSERTVIAEFPSFEAALEAYESPEYQAALEALDDGVVRDFRIVEGVEG